MREGKGSKWEEPISQQADPVEGTRPLQADDRREIMSLKGANTLIIISFPDHLKMDAAMAASFMSQQV